ncbi:MAG: helix-turn-helix domain-containing protein [Stomatobaculum sp.]
MTISYNGLWKLLIDKNMQRRDLEQALNISSSTIAKMGRGETVSMTVLLRICDYLDCNIGDIVSFRRE